MSNLERNNEPVDFVTIIGSDMAEITSEMHAQGLAADQFSIVHRVGRHRFVRVDGQGAETMFGGQQLIAATFQRRRNS